MDNPAAAGIAAAKRDTRGAENLRRIIATLEENLSEAEKDGNHELEFALRICLDGLYGAKPLGNGKLALTLEVA